MLKCIDDADRCIKLVRVFLTGLYEVDMVQDDTGWCQVVPGYSRWCQVISGGARWQGSIICKK